jgi:hypothetical protein
MYAIGTSAVKPINLSSFALHVHLVMILCTVVPPPLLTPNFYRLFCRASSNLNRKREDYENGTFDN